MPIPTNCPLCLAKANQQSVVTSHVYGGNSKQYAFFKCTSCDVNYLYPQLTKYQENNFYTKEFEGFMASRSGDNAGWDGPLKHIKANETQFKRRWQYLQKYLPPSGSILEIGCSSGFMLFPLKSMGYECAGVEPSGVFANYVNSQGITVLENNDMVKNNFDIIMHFFVLEHVRDPIKFLQSNLDKLKSGGKLIIEIPNAADPIYTIYNIPEFEKFYWSIAHHWYFTENSLEYVLKQLDGVSFSILRDQRYDLSNHMVWAMDGKPGGMGKFSDKLGIKVEDYYKQNLIETGKCDTLIAIVYKKDY